MENIELKKSVLAQYKGLGLTNKEMAERLGITSSEVNDALVHFGIKKGTSKKNKKTYFITYDDDLSFDQEPAQTNSSSDDAPAIENSTDEYYVEEKEEIEA